MDNSKWLIANRDAPVPRAPTLAPINKFVPVKGGIGYVSIDRSTAFPRATFGVVRRWPGHLPRRPIYKGPPSVKMGFKPGVFDSEVRFPMGRTSLTIKMQGGPAGGAIGAAVQHQNGCEAALVNFDPELKLTKHEANVLTDVGVGVAAFLDVAPKHGGSKGVAVGVAAGLLSWGLRELIESIEKRC